MSASTTQLEQLLFQASFALWPQLTEQRLIQECHLRPTLESGFSDMHSLLCLNIAKDLRRAPQELAAELMRRLPAEFEVNFSTLNGFLNFRIPDRELLQLEETATVASGKKTIKLQMQGRGCFFRLKDWAAVSLQASSGLNQFAECEVDFGGAICSIARARDAYPAFLKFGLERLCAAEVDAEQSNLRGNLGALSQPQLAALLYYLSTINSEEEFDWAVVRHGEKANLAWYLFCTLDRMEQLGLSRLEHQPASIDGAKLPAHLRIICVRVKLLGRFFDRVCCGEVRPYALALSELLGNVNGLINSPNFRHRLHVGSLTALEQTILAGINTVLSAMINRCSVLYLARGIMGAGKAPPILGEVEA